MMARHRYFDYLESDAWRQIRLRELTRTGSRCEDCGLCLRPHELQVHHMTYENLGQERPGELVVVCGACHERRHHGRLGDPCAPSWAKENPWLAEALARRFTDRFTGHSGEVPF